MLTLQRRAQFLAVRGGTRVSSRGFLIEAKRRDAKSGADPSARFGFTVTKKLGGAVERNRIRRRLKEAMRVGNLGLAVQGVDYVIVARPAAMTLPFAELEQDVAAALKKIGHLLAAPHKAS